MSRLRRILVSVLAASAASAALAVPAQTANAAVPVTQVIVWGDSMTQVWPGYLDALLPVPVIQNGMGADNIQQTLTRFNQWYNSASDPVRASTGHICWCGHTNVNRVNNNPQTIVPTLVQMANLVPAGQFMAIGLTNSPLFPRGSASYDIAIRDTTAPFSPAVNQQMASNPNFVYAEIRGYLVEDGLERAGITPTAQDEQDIANDVVPASLRTANPDQNPGHLSDVGKQIVAARLDDLVRAQGWVAPETRIATTTDLESSTNPSAFGSPVVVEATVSRAAGGTPTPTGTVQFHVDGRAVGAPVNLQAGVARSAPLRNLSVGNHTVTALYNGNLTYASSTDTITQVVTSTGTEKLTSATAITSSMNPAPRTQRVRFSATVTNASGVGGQPTPTGTVQFSLNGVRYGNPITVNASGVAITPLIKLSAGQQTITAVYSGNTTYLSSNAPPYTQTMT